MPRKLNPSRGREDRPPAHIIGRILAGYYIDPNARANTCWIWQRHKDANGYGQVRMEGRTEWVHRIMYLIFNGPLVDGAHIDHTCFNPSCGNPDHLRQTTMEFNSGTQKRRAQIHDKPPSPEDPPI